MSFKFTSIDQFRSVVRNVKHQAQYTGVVGENGNPVMDRTKRMPKIRYIATTKIHGSNSGIQYFPKTGHINYLSRERILTLEQDNAGFMLYMKSIEDTFIRPIMSAVYTTHNPSDKIINSIVLYGEWCGGNIQKGVAVSGLDKMICPFAIKIIESGEKEYYIPAIHQELPFSTEARIYPVGMFKTWLIDIDFEKPEEAQNKLVEICMQVEEECPVGTYFGRVKGTDNTVGEGVVIRPLHFSNDFDGTDYPHINFKDFGLAAKIKGEKHSNSKVKILASVDVEAVENIREFVEYAVTEARMENMLQKMQTELLKPFEMSSMGDFIRLLYSDILKEETDTIVANQLEPKKLGGPIANVARKWYITKFNSEV
jgi:hypothetical protein